MPYLRQFLTRPGPVDPTRRRLLLGGFGAIALLGTGTCLTGVAGATGSVRLRPMTLEFPDLPPDLVGFKILHLTDAWIFVDIQLLISQNQH